MSGLWDALKQYMRDASPGGVLNPEVTRQGLLDTAAVASTPVPLLGDAMGLLADVNRYATDPSSRTPGNFALSGLGLLPFVPGMTVSKKARTAGEWWHGSPADIYGADGKGWFKLSAGESGVPVVWATRDPFTAEGYTRGQMALEYDKARSRFPLEKSYYKDYDGGGGVYNLVSKAKKPYQYDAEGKQWFMVPQGTILKKAQENGHDAVVFKNIRDGYQNSGPTSDVIAWLNLQAFERGK